MSPIIKIYIATHKNIYIPNHPLLFPLQIGTSLQQPFHNMLHDNNGKHISEKNDRYCELTAQYWAWKNEMADYYGFYHYRRYFTFSPEKRPYLIYDFPNDSTLHDMGYMLQQMTDFIQQYDVLVPKAENMYESVWDNYRRAPYHFITDLKHIVQILQQTHPDYHGAIDEYMNGTQMYLKNMYIMKNTFFHQYCDWLFPLLEEFDQSNDWSKYNNHYAALRVDGYLAERLFGIWYTNLKHQSTIRSCELSRIHFAYIDDEKGSLKKMKLVNMILPPGTRRRSIVSSCARSILCKQANRKLKRV